MIEGGCFCGKVRFVIDEGEYPSVSCHCSMCRRIHAAPYVDWIVVPVSHFKYRSGTPVVLASSAHGQRFFCQECGTHVACINAEHSEIIDVPTGSLDEVERFEPTVEIHSDTRLPWLLSPGDR
jgi:hypothetical protein